MRKNELYNLKKTANRLGLCTQYADKWNNAMDKRSLVDIGIDAKGADFLCDSCSNGWGLTIEYLKREFAEYINGNYQRKEDGYTSELYVDYTGNIEQRSTLTLLIGCKCNIHIGKDSVCEIYLSGGSDIRIKNDGYCAVYVYGKECRYVVEGNVVHETFIANSEPHINH